MPTFSHRLRLHKLFVMKLSPLMTCRLLVSLIVVFLSVHQWECWLDYDDYDGLGPFSLGRSAMLLCPENNSISEWMTSLLERCFSIVFALPGQCQQPDQFQKRKYPPFCDWGLSGVC